MKIHTPLGIFLCILCATILIVGVAAADNSPTTTWCPQFDYTMKVYAEVTGLTRFETDLVVPSEPTSVRSGYITEWGIFPYIEPVINANDPRFGILQPVLEWDYNRATRKWTLTPWYEDLAIGNTMCGSTEKYCKCTQQQERLGRPAITKHYLADVPDCHKRCDPKHGQRISAYPGNVIHFTISQSGDIWTTTAKNTNTGERTQFQTTCIKPTDRLKVGFALEKQLDERVKNDANTRQNLPGNIVFNNIKFTGGGNIRLAPEITPEAKKCFPWLEVKITADTITFVTQPLCIKKDL